MRALAFLTGASLLLGLTGCAERRVELTAAELAVASAAGIPEDLAQLLRGAGSDLERLTGVDDQDNSTNLPGITTAVSGRSANDTLLRLRKAVPPGYFVFVNGFDAKSTGIFSGLHERIAIVRGRGPYEMLAAMQTNGANYQISTEMVIAKLREWDARYGLDIEEIDRDSVGFEMQRKPGNMVKFAHEVFEFCPDTVNQGAGTLLKLATEIERTNGVSLWWD